MIEYVDIHTHHPTGLHIEPQGIGTHPWDVLRAYDTEENLEEAVVIGEIGLDFAKEIDHSMQEVVFRRQLIQAERLDLPIVLHCVKAFEQTMNILAEYKLRAVIFHCFIGSEQQAERAINRGYFLSFGDKVLHSPKSIKALKYCPLEQIFAETDESSITIEQMYSIIAELRGVNIETLAQQIKNNYDRIFTK